MKFSNFMSRGGAFASLFCPEGRVFVHNEYLGGGFLLPSSRVPEGMVLDKMDTCITFTSSCQSNIAFLILQSGHSIQGSLINNKGFLCRLLLAAGGELVISDLNPYRLFPQYW